MSKPAINITVTDKQDTLGDFDYDRPKDYDFYTFDGQDSIFSNKDNLEKFPGQFGFGIKGRVTKSNMLLLFRGEPNIKLEIGVARGLKKYDKRDKLKKRDIKRDMMRERK